MDAGHEPGAIERAVLAAERRVYRKKAWYKQPPVWGSCGMVIGFAAGVLWQQVLLPEHAEAKSAPYVASAPQKLVGETVLKPETPRAAIPEKPADQPAKPIVSDKQLSEFVKAADFPVLPRPARELSGSLSGLPTLPDVQVAPAQPQLEAKVPERKIDPESELKKAKVKALSERIVKMRLDREELLKTFYEDAVPVKHLDEDIAAAEAEMKSLQAS